MTSSPGAQPVEPPAGTLQETRLLLEEQFEERDLVALRQAVAAHADRTGLPTSRVGELMLIAFELATNAVRHGGGRGRLRLWVADGLLHCQVSDHGPGISPAQHIPRTRPEPGAVGGRGLWLVSQFSDNFAVHSDHEGASVTATVHLPPTP
ncbi:ATP-binding protein [Micromonospora sp. NPDC049679]|uniref:ATP-binding protein n=1 Tax=Micromonospora sp. NPDC049679 TaxID=3155920 RepID=UPI0033F2E7C0